MKNTTNKIVLVGSGAVGTSFLYSAINRGIGNEFGIIDIAAEVAKGNELDLEDAIPAINPGINKIEAGGYNLVKDADVIVITAGRPQKPGETRLEMVKDNAKIMKTIAEEIKKNGFSGITIIASNPVDIMTQVYQKVTNFDATKVISSGTSLDSSRLRVELAKKINVNPASIQAYVLGEHGDSSVSTLKYAKIGGICAKEFYKKAGLEEKELEQIHESVWKKAYEIIDRKRATFYGIGANLANIVRAVINDTNEIMAVGAKLQGQYGINDIYFGTPCVIGKNGINQILEFKLSDQEKEQLLKSESKIKEALNEALKAI